MHPFIENFLKSPLAPNSIFEENLSKDKLVEATIINIKNILKSKEYDNPTCLELIENSLLEGHEDSDIFIMFISYSIVLFSNRRQNEFIQKFISIGENLIPSNINPEILVWFYQACAFGKWSLYENRGEKLYQEKAKKLVDRNSPKYKTLLTNYSGMLARYGMLNDLEPLDKEMLNSKEFTDLYKDAYIYEINMVNCIMQGDYIKGLDFLSAFQKLADFKKDWRFEHATTILNILSGNRDLSFYSTEEDGRAVANIFEDFYENRWDTISKKIMFIKNLSIKHILYFIVKYLPLHYELSIRHSGMCKYILQENKKIGQEHFMDDLFYSRIALIENKRNEAIFYFQRLIINVKKYGFEPRLKFELQFAKELSASDLFYLIDKSSELKEKNIILEPINAPNEVEKKGLDLIVGKSNLIIKTKKLIRKYSIIHEPVLVTGETGTGKELVAKALHDLGPNASDPFLAINCGTLSDTLLQSELFGYVAGAFTGAQKAKKGIFEAAGNGTVFLDEFEDVSPKMQSSLLRVLESNEIRLLGDVNSKKINCKIIIATNKPLKELVGSKSFREDLYFRLARFEIKLPSLKERQEDIPELIHHFLFSPNQNNFTPELSNELLEKLSSYSWPGNIRELRNAIDKMRVLYSDLKRYGVEEFDFEQLEDFATIKLPPINTPPKNNPLSIKSIDLSAKDRIEKIMNRGSKASEHLPFLKELFLEYKNITRSQVMEILNLSPFNTATALKALCDEGFIIKITPTKSTKSHYYQIKQ